MTFTTTTVSSTHTYRGTVEINFFQDDKGRLSATLDNDEIHMRMIGPSEQDIAFQCDLFADGHVMEKYATGVIAKEKTVDRVNNVWVKRREKQDPYVGFAVFQPNSDECLGDAIFGHGVDPGHAEIAYLFHQKYWHQGWATRAVTALVKEYSHATVEEGYKTLGGEILKTINATARLDNPYSCRILEKLGMHEIGKEEKYGALRNKYAINLSEIPKPNWQKI